MGVLPLGVVHLGGVLPLRLALGRAEVVERLVETHQTTGVAALAARPLDLRLLAGTLVGHG